jgi:dynactin-6
VGDVTIGSKTIVHPACSIRALKGPIVIGECNLIEERVNIVNTSEKPMIIGSFNVFEVGTHCESPAIGDHNVLEYKSFVGKNTTLTTGCVIGAKCRVETAEQLPPNTVIFGSECRRRIQIERPTPQTYQRDFLIKILPNYQKIEKPNFTPEQNVTPSPGPD